MRKLALYERYGVKELWIVHPDDRIVMALRLEGDRYGRPEIAETRETTAPALFPDLAIDWALVFAKIAGRALIPSAPHPASRPSNAAESSFAATDAAVKLHRNWIADHRRESIAFGRGGEAVIERLSVMAVVRNLIQGVSERRNDRSTPAKRLGVTSRPWTWRDVLSERRFPTRIPLGETASRVYKRTMRDPRGISWPPHVRLRAL